MVYQFNVNEHGSPRWKHALSNLTCPTADGDTIPPPFLQLASIRARVLHLRPVA